MTWQNWFKNVAEVSQQMAKLKIQCNHICQSKFRYSFHTSITLQLQPEVGCISITDHHYVLLSYTIQLSSGRMELAPQQHHCWKETCTQPASESGIQTGNWLLISEQKQDLEGSLSWREKSQEETVSFDLIFLLNVAKFQRCRWSSCFWCRSTCLLLFAEQNVLLC